MRKKKKKIIPSLKEAFDKQLTNSQEEAVSCLELFHENELPVFILRGYAGTGKTFLIKGLYKYFKSMDRDCFFMAPTGRAARILSQKTGVRAHTIHKTIYQIDVDRSNTYNTETGREKYFYELRTNTAANSVFIIDEASMLSDTYSEGELFRFGSGFLLKDLIQFVNPQLNKIIFIGDPAQLPPVNSSLSPALDLAYLSERYNIRSMDYEMKDVVRQSEESGILINATRLRKSVQKKEFRHFELSLGQKDISKIDIDLLDKNFLEMHFSENDLETIIIAQSNRRVQGYNELVRSSFFPGQDEISTGDRVLLVHNNYNYDIDLMNGDTAEVIHLDDFVEHREVHIFKDGFQDSIDLYFRDSILRFRDILGKPHDIECKIYEPLLYSPYRDISQDEMKAIYVDFIRRNKRLHHSSPEFFMAIRNDPYYNCLRLKFGYAATCHKAQGGEWKNVLVDLTCDFPSGYRSETYFRWAYTALTRCSENLFLINFPEKFFDIEAYTEPGTISDSTSFYVKEKAVPYEHFIQDKSQDIVKKIFIAVSKLIAASDLKIMEIKHFPYCERYILAKDKQPISVNIWYNAKSKISLIDTIPGPDEKLKNLILELFQPLSGRILEWEEKDQ